MKQLTPQTIAEITNGRYVGDEQSKEIQIKGAVRDNREVRPGNLFVCIKGARVDGHSFANNAFDKGAACCLTQEEIPDAKGPYVVVSSTLEAIKTIGAYHRSLFNIPIIGITGSVGKTTGKELIAAVLGAKYKTLRTSGNLNNELGVPLTLLSLDETHQAAVIEMGISDFGEMSRLAQMVRPDIFVMTKIGYAHLDNLGDLNGVLKAKTETFKYMKADGVAVLNGDDELLWTYDPGIKRIMYGCQIRNDVFIHNVVLNGINSITFDVEFTSAILSEAKNPKKRTYVLPHKNSVPREIMHLSNVNIPAYGAHIVELVGAAIAVGSLLELSEDEIKKGFTEFKPTGGRANIKNTGTITLIDDCYNANPNSVKAALTSLSKLPVRRVAILGDMLELGIQTDSLHFEIGEFAYNAGIDCLICNGEKAKYIYDGYVDANTKASEKKDNAYYFSSKAELILKLSDLIKKDDAVLVKASNGMKFNEIVQELT